MDDLHITNHDQSMGRTDNHLGTIVIRYPTIFMFGISRLRNTLAWCYLLVPSKHTTEAAYLTDCVGYTDPTLKTYQQRFTIGHQKHHEGDQNLVVLM